MNEDTLSRRTVLTMAGPGALGSSVLASAAFSQAGPQGSSQTPVQLPPFKADTERQSGEPPAPLPPSERVGIAIVGLGRLSVEELLPAIGHAKKVKLAALVSGTPAKARTLAQQYGLAESSVYGYGDMARLADNKAVQAVYIVLPNGMHHEYTLKAFAAGKHVLCEKPMANTSKECEEMIAAGEKAGKHLMVAYRIQYEPHNRLIRKWVRDRKYGPVKLIEGCNIQRQGEPEQWRHKKALAGGGSLPDIGLYCLNTTRFLLGEEPTEVSAMIYSTPGDPRFKEVEENVIWHMRFPSGALASLSTGYDAHESRRYRVHAPLGWVGMDPAFSYSGLRMQSGHAEGKEERIENVQLGEKNQFALEMDHFADALRKNQRPFTPGEEGLQDQRITEAIYASAQSGRPVKLKPAAKLDAFRGTEPSES